MADRSLLDQLLGREGGGLDGTQILPEELQPMGEINGDQNPLIQPRVSPPPIPPPGTGLPGGVPMYPEAPAPIDPLEQAMIDQMNAPQYVDRNTGSTTKSTTTQERSAETVAAEKELTDAQAEYEKSIAAEQKAIDEQAKAQADLDKADNEAIRTVETARAEAREMALMDVESDLADIDARVAAFTNQKPETFWGSKSTSDKIASALSVGLGSFAQSLTGSGQNVGMVLLQRQMDEFDRNQETQYKKQLMQINSMKASMDTKRQLIGEADKTFDAKKLAARAQVQSQLGRAMTMAKTGTVKAALGQKLAEFDKSVASLRMSNASKYEAKHTQNVESKTFERVQLAPGMGPDGKPKTYTEGQTKARLTYADLASANQALKGFDLEKVNSDPVFQKYLSDKRSRKAADSIPVIGKPFAAGMDSIIGNPEEKLKERKPELVQAISAMNAWTQAVTRFKTGAAIGPDEVEVERATYFPVPGDTPEVVKDKEKTRKALEAEMRKAGAL